MKCRKAYGIMPVGENDRSAHVAQQKAPEVATPGLFYSVLGGWLNPKAGYQLFFSVQPFADVVGNYTWKEPAGIYPFLCAGEANREYGRYQGTYPGTETDREQPQPDSKAV